MMKLIIILNDNQKNNAIPLILNSLKIKFSIDNCYISCYLDLHLFVIFHKWPLKSHQGCFSGHFLASISGSRSVR